jgi:hypothetical protein
MSFNLCLTFSCRWTCMGKFRSKYMWYSVFAWGLPLLLTGLIITTQVVYYMSQT